ncbi:MAG: 5-formyltetrahydrofolate cyclo-ligase [Prevotellaceae bacterium]|nr:5-formyltetrahydrofolate cyclo-ligase [Prevotellaceae bacterium]MDY3857070.1 5-formyltetrahydrofolate cyclo-ligase [Bacteroidaceae bacterium]
MSKSEQRRLIRLLKLQYTSGQLAEWSARLMSRLEEMPMFRQAKSVLLYHPLPDEVDTRILLEHWRDSKRLLLPRVCGDELTVHPYLGPSSLCSGAYHIMEPTTPALTSLGDVDIAIIPGMAFDKAGHRLGRGRGYYDHLLSSPDMAHTYKIGLCFPFQLLDKVEAEAHDVLMNEILS